MRLTTLFCCARLSSTHNVLYPTFAAVLALLLFPTGLLALELLWPTVDVSCVAKSVTNRFAAGLPGAGRPIASSVKRNLHAMIARTFVTVATCGLCWHIIANFTDWMTFQQQVLRFMHFMFIINSAPL
jgi:hypothetical protein